MDEKAMLVDVLTLTINEGVYKPNERLPSENELADQYKIPRIVVRKAYEQLQERGLVYAKQGKGSYVQARKVTLGLIFAVAASLGSVAAVIGMTFHSVSYLIKAYSESFEELDKGVIEALQASGASWWQIVFQAVIPSSITYMISWTFLRFEINFAVAIAMGAAAGAGGIGFDMFMAGSFYYDIREIGTVTYFILTVAILLELLAAQIKNRLKVNI